MKLGQIIKFSNKYKIINLVGAAVNLRINFEGLKKYLCMTIKELKIYFINV
jgi:hypothetical protein